MGEIVSRHSCYTNYLKFMRFVAMYKMYWLFKGPRRKWKNDIDMYIAGLGANVSRTELRIAVGERDFSLLQHVETG